MRFNLTLSVPKDYNADMGYMKGSITCSRCGSRMDEDTGLCVRCGGKSCAVKVYWKGKQHRFRRGFKNKVLNYITANKYLDYIRSEIDRLGDDFDPVVYSGKAVRDRIFEVVWARFIAEKQKLVEKEKRSPEYIRVLESYYRAHYQGLHDRDVRDITKATVKNLHDRIIAKSKTAKNIMDGLRTFLRWCFDAGLIDVVPPFPVVEVDDETLRAALGIEAQKEQFSLIPEEHRDVYVFEGETGLRPGEVCALKIADIDLANAVMIVRRTFSGQQDRKKTKQKKEYFLPLSPVAVEIAGKHMRNRLGEPERLYLFINPVTGKHYTRHYLGDTWNKHTTVAADGVRHYDGTRRSFCTQLVDSGVNPLHAKELMRHSSMKMTERYYHGNITILRSALEKRSATVIPIKEEKTENE